MRTLVVRAGALGDLLLLRPAIASLRRAGATVTLLAPERPASALIGEGDEEAQRLFAWDGPATARLLSGEDAATSLRDTFGTYDVALCYSRNAELARRLEVLASRVIVHDPAPAFGHAAAWLAQPLDALGIPHVDAAPLVPSPDDLAAVSSIHRELPADFLAVHPGSGSMRKNWPAPRFVALAARVAANRPWLLSLGPADDQTARELGAADRAVITRDLPPRRLGALLSTAGLYVGNDSGVSHLAAAYGVPTVPLFGPTDPAVWAPLGARVRIIRARHETMESLELDEVLAATTERAALR